MPPTLAVVLGSYGPMLGARVGGDGWKMAIAVARQGTLCMPYTAAATSPHAGSLSDCDIRAGMLWM